MAYPLEEQVKLILKLLPVMACVAGCATQAPLAPSGAESTRLFERNYTVGVRGRASVGDPVVKVKDYFVERVERLAVRPTHDVTMTRAMSPTLSFSANRTYPITHRIDVDGVSCFVVPDPANQAIAAVVRPDGTILQRFAGIIYGSPMLAWADGTVSPPHARMPQDVEERVVRTKGYVNFELIYNGASGGSIHLSYREFTPDDIARTAFYQNLTYDAKVETIRFRHLRIQAHTVTNEMIEYTVLEDSR